MSWTKIPRAPGNAAAVEGLNVRITAKGYDSPHLIIRVARTLAAKAGIPPDVKSRVDVLLGAGADAGGMRVVHDPAGAHGAFPQGKRGAVRIVFKQPAGMPPEYPDTMVDLEFPKGGGVVFALPWHKRAADREVEELPAVVHCDDDAYRTTVVPVTVGDFISATVPATLDAVEETARPAPNGHALQVPESGEPIMLPFTHKGQTVELEKIRHAVATALYKVLGKGYVAAEMLLRTYGGKDRAALLEMVGDMAKDLAPLRLEAGLRHGRGYWMREV